MAIPNVFITEFVDRCEMLLGSTQEHAQRNGLTATYLVMRALSCFVVPYERLRARHPFRSERKFDRNEEGMFLTAAFWQSTNVGQWRYAKVRVDPSEGLKELRDWECPDGKSFLSSNRNDVREMRTGTALSVLRNALAHGNVAYMNSEGAALAGAPVTHLCFVSVGVDRQGRFAETAQVLITTENAFSHFLDCWSNWTRSQYLLRGDFVGSLIPDAA